MTQFTRLARGVDVAPLVAQIEAHPELWNSVSYRKETPGSPHSEMSDIWVRYNDIRPYAAAGDYSTMKDAHIPVWYPAWHLLPALRPLVFDLMAAVQGEMIGAIFITRIPHGAGIDPHYDGGWHPEYFDKFYISLKSAPGAVFHTEEESYTPEVGDVFHFDNRVLHWVTNDSGQDRMTLIICIRNERFTNAPVSYSRDTAIPNGMAGPPPLV